MQPIKVLISKIVEETPDTRSFYLERADGASIPYVAGQFLTLIFHINGKEVRRSYSIGSSPGFENSVFITVKRKENGEISRKLQDAYKAGDELTCLLPSGKFVRDVHWGTDLHYFFFAAGSGIVPIFGIIKSILHENSTAKIFLLNQATSENNIIFKTALEILDQRFDNFEYILYLSRPNNPTIPVRRLNNLQVERLVKQRILDEKMKQNSRFYICGPTTFMRMVKFTLRLDGFEEDQIKQEQFVIQETKNRTPLLLDTSPKKVKVIAAEGIFEFSVQYPDSILKAGRNANVAMPFSCNAGQCSTCAVRCVDGNVVMGENDILTQKDISSGLILTCTGHPTTDIVLNYTLKN